MELIRARQEEYEDLEPLVGEFHRVDATDPLPTVVTNVTQLIKSLESRNA